ncbi:hypothetical protein ACFTUC_27505 [Streptomyces sp. NPDC056944]|uniref:hypothetical protein n=1 Tax=Streptomyces sp. NPDC056944 TaxID=3345972 RepID=UPI003634B879
MNPQPPQEVLDANAPGGAYPGVAGVGTAGVRLGEPAPSPRVLAEEHHISPRHLHKLFQAEGTTFCRWVRGRRLSECRAELERTDRDHLPVSVVAADGVHQPGPPQQGVPGGVRGVAEPMARERPRPSGLRDALTVTW